MKIVSDVLFCFVIMFYVVETLMFVFKCTPPPRPTVNNCKQKICYCFFSTDSRLLITLLPNDSARLRERVLITGRLPNESLLKKNRIIN